MGRVAQVVVGTKLTLEALPFSLNEVEWRFTWLLCAMCQTLVRKCSNS